jgi:5'-nucleotidase / UDP-sugar diphosphatase
VNIINSLPSALGLFLFILASSIGGNAVKKHELIILHTNDIHARILGVRDDDSMCGLKDRDSHNCFGGFDRIFTRVRAEKEANVLLLDAGDQFQGTMFHFFYKGIASANLMNLIGYTAMAVGNHEFDDGPKALAAFIRQARFPLLSANIDVSKSNELKNLIKPYVVVRKNGLRIGILGYTTKDSIYLSSPGPHVAFLPIIDSVKKAVAALKDARVDVIVAVSHAGLNIDIEVAKSISGIAAIVCGHTNSLLSNQQKKADGKSPLVIYSPDQSPVLLVSAYAYGKFLGRLKFSFDAQGKPISWESEPILLNSQVKRNPRIKKQIDKLYQPISDFEKQIVGSIPVNIDGKTCRFQECALGNLIADSMLNYARKFGVSIAFMNGGGIRASLKKGIVSQAELENVLPFAKTLVLLKLKGAVIRKILEHGVAHVDQEKNGNTGRFLQVSGLKYSFDPRKPTGSRIKDIWLVRKNTLEPLVEDNFYGVVTNSYLVDGGDDFTFFAESKELWRIELTLKDLLAQFFQTSLSQLPKTDGRIVNLSLFKAPSIQKINTY